MSTDDVAELEKKLSEFMAEPEEGAAALEKGDVLNRPAFAFHRSEPAPTEEVGGQAQELSEKFGYVKGQASRLRSMGFSLGARGELGQAIEFYRNALETYEGIDEKRNLAATYGYLRDLHEIQERFNLGLECFFTGLEVFSGLADKGGISHICNQIGSVCISLKKYEEARQYLQREIKLARDIGSSQYESDSLSLLFPLYAEKADYQKAFEYLSSHGRLREEIFSRESEARINQLKVQYETEKKEGEAEIHRLKSVEFEEWVQRRMTEIKKPRKDLETDIDKHKKTEELLKAEVELNTNILNATPDTIFTFDPETFDPEAFGPEAFDHEVGKPLKWNKEFREISGYSDEVTASKKSPDEWFGEEDLKRAATTVEVVYESGQGTVEMPLKIEDGARIPTEYVGSHIRDEQGNPEFSSPWGVM